MTSLKDVDVKIIAGLMKNSKISDRKLADIIGVSQPTITRRRAKLEKELSAHYTMIPDFSKLGMEIITFHLVQWKPMKFETPRQKKDFEAKVEEFLSKNPNIIFIGAGQGLGMSRMCVSIHKSYSDYAVFLREFETEWNQYTMNHDSFIVSLKGDQVRRPLTFKYLADYIQKAR
ncbi:MAG: Lrp/AsnC family transcriptional regulator [Candidatus Bathyarchaeota archaeon]|nr:MAG: Lrp/AsnC family transcriptional regulator [Candidatus Bathyarchaeota archaeon]